MKKLLPVLFCAMLLVVSCSMIKAPAQLAIKAAEEALNTVRAEADQFVPDQLAAIEATLNGARQSFEKGDYKAALVAAKDLPAKIKDLAAAIEARKAELPRNWTELSAELPKLIAGTKNTVEQATAELGPDNAALKSARTGMAEINTAWTEAQEAFNTGNLIEAVNKAREIKAKAAQIMVDLQPVETVKK
jgi:hypothetical protein